MQVLAVLGARPHRREKRRVWARNPELWALCILLAAWAVLIERAARATGGSASGGMASMPGMTMPMSASRAPWATVAAGIPGWVIMSVAMMGPAALAGVRHTRINSLRWRRARAMVEFSVAYLGVWTAAGVAILAVSALVPGLVSWTATAVALALAAIWQLTPTKRRALRACHRSVPLPPSGWRAELGAMRFGLHNGRACLGSCWAMMLVMSVVPSAPILWSGMLTGVITTERALERPRRATRLATLALAVTALAAGATALI